LSADLQRSHDHLHASLWLSLEMLRNLFADKVINESTTAITVRRTYVIVVTLQSFTHGICNGLCRNANSYL